MVKQTIFKTRQEFEGTDKPKTWRDIVSEHNSRQSDQPTKPSAPAEPPPKRLDEIATEGQGKSSSLELLKAKKRQQQRQEKFRVVRNYVKNQSQLDNWHEATDIYGLSGSNYYRSLRYANDLNQGLKLLEKINRGVSIFGSRFPQEGSEQYEQARQLAARLAQSRHTVVTGGGPGIMEAANRGAYEAGGKSVGLKIHLPNMDEPPNQYTTDQMTFQYFFARKVMLIAASKLFVFFPGGFGTLDELTEVLVLLQERKMAPTPVFLFGSGWWKSLDDYLTQALMNQGFLNPGDLDLYTITDSVDEIVAAAGEIPDSQIADMFAKLQ
jgi:uncharacterized protein (TIGR00730 family)